MGVTIIRNDSYIVLAVASGVSENDLEGKIVKKLIEEGIFYGENEDVNKSIEEIGKGEGYSQKELVDLIFPDKVGNTEIGELLKGIVFFGDGFENPCPCCGCELEFEMDEEMGAKWEEITCSNSDCGHTEMNDLSEF